MGLFQSTTKWITINEMKTYDAVIKKNGNENELKLYQTILDVVPSLTKNITSFGQKVINNPSHCSYNIWLLGTTPEFINNHKGIDKLEICIPINTYNDLIDLHTKIMNRLKGQEELPPPYDDVDASEY